jgi:hypothetical protein
MIRSLVRRLALLKSGTPKVDPGAPDLLCREVADAEVPQPEPDGKNHFCLWGGLEPAPTWKKYVKMHGSAVKPLLEAGRLWLLAREGEIPNAIDWAATHYLAFSDGRTLSFTDRAWGDFAQAVVDMREGYLSYFDGRYDWPDDED